MYWAVPIWGFSKPLFFKNKWELNRFLKKELIPRTGERRMKYRTRWTVSDGESNIDGYTFGKVPKQ